MTVPTDRSHNTRPPRCGTRENKTGKFRRKKINKLFKNSSKREIIARVTREEDGKSRRGDGGGRSAVTITRWLMSARRRCSSVPRSRGGTPLPPHRERIKKKKKTTSTSERAVWQTPHHTARQPARPPTRRRRRRRKWTAYRPTDADARRQRYFFFLKIYSTTTGRRQGLDWAPTGYRAKLGFIHTNIYYVRFFFLRNLRLYAKKSYR